MGNIILIGGGSCSGKSTIADSVAEALRSDVSVCSIDSYYKDLSDISEDDIKDYNFDVPSAIDIESLVDDITMLTDGLAVHVPLYDYQSHKRVGYKIVGPCKILIVEGLFALYFSWLRNKAGLKIFVDCKESERFYRRLKRDVELRNLERKEVINRYQDSVQQMFEKYVLPTRNNAEIIINGEDDIDYNVAEILSVLDEKLLMKGGL